MRKTNMIYALLLIGALASCRKDEVSTDRQEETSGKVNFRLSANNDDPTFRTGHTDASDKLVVTWLTNDKIGLFSVVGTETKNANAVFTIAADQDITEAGKKAVFGGEISQSGDWDMDFYAYYPYSTAQTNSKAIAVSVVDQVIDGKESKNLAKYDILVADPVKGVKAGASNTTLNFKHIMAVADFNISLPAGAEQQQIKEIKLLRADGKGIATSGTVDITAAAEADRLKITSSEAQQTYAQLAKVENVSLAAGESFHARVALLPADYSSTTLSIFVTTDKGTYKFDKTNIKAEAGKRHKAELKLETKVAVNIGDYYYSDGTWSTEINAAKKVVGIVVYKGQQGGATNGFVMSLVDVDNGKYGKLDASAYFDVPEIPNLTILTSPTRNGTEDWDGQAHAKIIAAKREDASYAGLNFILQSVDFAPADVTAGPAVKGQWYTPAVNQMRSITDSRVLIDSKLTAINATVVNTKSYWTSSEREGSSSTVIGQAAWSVGFNYSGVELYTSPQTARNLVKPVRPFLNF